MSALFSNPVLSRKTSLIAVFTLALIASATGLGDPAYAQQQPTSLLPINEDEQVETLDEGAANGAATITATGIEVDSLGGLDLDSIGTMDLSRGGLGYDMWRQSRYEDAVALMEQLPEHFSSRTANQLVRRLLLSSAAQPLRSRAQQGQYSILDIRVEKLAELGAYRDLENLLQRVPQHSDSDARAWRRVESLLMVGKNEEACRQIRQTAKTATAEIWQRAMVYCHLQDGSTDLALLGVDLLRETGAATDPLFNELVLAGAGMDVALSGQSAGPVNVLHWALSRLSGTLIPEALDDFMVPGVRQAMVGAEDYPLERRVAAAEQIVDSGGMAARALIDLYSLYDFAPEELDAVVAEDPSFGGPKARALYTQAVQLQSVPAARAEIVVSALKHAAQDGRELLMARVLADLIREIQPTADLAWFALPAGRSLFVSNHYSEAEKWVLLARQYMLTEPTAAASLTGLWPYARLAGADPSGRAGSLKGWGSAQSDIGEEALNQRMILLRSSFQALGEQVRMNWGELASLEAVSPGLAPSAALLYALQEAQTANRMAEVVLLSLLILGENGPAETHSFALGRVIEALSFVGLQDEARALAIEAAAASGI